MSNQIRVDSLNVLRIGLIFAVFLCHSSDFLPERIGYYAGTLTGYALILFFMVSGFCCVLSAWDKKPQNAFSYVWKRIKKIYPAHFIAYLAMLFLIFKGYGQLTSKEILKQSFFNLTFLQAWVPNEDYIYSINGPAWFLSALMFCYLLTPLLVRFLKKHAAFAVWGAVALPVIQLAYAMMYEYWGLGNYFLFTNVFPPYRFLEYATGACLAVVYLQQRKHGKIMRSSAVQIAALLIYFLLLYGTKNMVGYTRFFVFANIFLLYSWAFFEGVVTDLGANKHIVRMAAEIMPFYLMHGFVLKAVRMFVYGGDYQENPLLSVALWAVMLLVTMALSWLYYALGAKMKAVVRRNA